LAWAETLNARDIFIGVNGASTTAVIPIVVLSLSRSEDERMAKNLATKAGVDGSGAIRIHAPLIRWTKAEIIQQGLSLGVDYS
jgi:7-cyano-7-deazaguanine synthase